MPARRPSPALAILLLAAATGAAAQAPRTLAGTVPFPGTPEGRLAAELVAVLNGGSEEEQRGYAAGLSGGNDGADLLVAAFRQSGGVDLVRFEAEPGRLRATLRARRTGRLALLSAAVDPGGERLAGFELHPVPTAWDSAALGALTPLESVRAHLDGLAAQDEFSGVVLVASGDRVLWQLAYGWADRERGVAVGADTRFHVASVGKMFTAVAIAQLAEQGRLRFTDTLGALLPDHPDAAARAAVTVHHLLTHSSGMGGLFDRPGFDRRRRVTLQGELLPVFAGEPLGFAPGTRDRYSSEGYVVLGAIVERLSGLPYEEYLRRHVFGPAGMTGAACEMVGPSGPGSRDAAVGYVTAPADPFGMEPRVSSAPLLGWECGAAGGGYLRAADLHAFAGALFGGRLVGKRTLETMLGARGVAEWRGYGIERHTRRGHAVYGHGGGGGLGIGAEVRTVPAAPGGAPLTVVVLSNYDAVARPIAELVLDLELAARRGRR